MMDIEEAGDISSGGTYQMQSTVKHTPISKYEYRVCLALHS